MGCTVDEKTPNRMKFILSFLGMFLVPGRIYMDKEVQLDYYCWKGSGRGTKEGSGSKGINKFLDFGKLTKEVFGEDLTGCNHTNTFAEFKKALTAPNEMRLWTPMQQENDFGNKYGFYACKVKSKKVVDKIRINLLNITDPSVKVQVVVKKCTGVQEVVQDMLEDAQSGGSSKSLVSMFIIMASLFIIFINQ